MDPLVFGSSEPDLVRTASATAGYLLNGDAQGTQLLVYLAALALVLLSVVWWGLTGRRDPLAKAPPRANNLQAEAVFLAALAYLGTSALFYALLGTEGLGGAEGADGETVSLIPARLFRAVVVTNGSALAATAVCLWLALSRFEGGLRGFLIGRLGVKSVLGWAAGLTLVSCIACEAVLYLTVTLFAWLAPAYEFAEHSVIDILRDDDSGDFALVLAWVGAAVIAPLAEEVFFRGFLQTFLVNWLRSRWVAILLAALAFTLVHAQVHALPALLLFGVILGYAYERTGSLVVPILVHALFNLKTLIGVMWLLEAS